MKGYADLPDGLVPHDAQYKQRNASHRRRLDPDTAQTEPRNMWAKRIRLIREKGNLTQQNLAVDLGVTAGTINRWESGDVTDTAMTDHMLATLVRLENYWVYDIAEA